MRRKKTATTDEDVGTEKEKLVKLVGLNARFSHSCLALFYLRNELAAHCPSLASEIVQGTINDNYYEFLLQLTEGEPWALLFSTAIWNSTLVERLLVDLHRCLPTCRLVVGGPQAAVVGERLGADLCTVVIGAIEAVDPDFYRHLATAGLQPLYRAERHRAGFSFPYRAEDFSGPLANRHIYYESSRGCPFSCSYCLSATEPGVVHKELAVVAAELAEILAHRPKVVRFVDRTFNDRPERALAIWRLLAELGGETLFHFEVAPERLSEEMLAFLAGLPPGRFQFEIGIQSTNPATLAAINRRIEPQAAAQTVRLLAAAGNIHLHVDLILGLPREDRESFATSFRQLFAMGAHYMQLGLLKILPGTPISRQAAEWGYRWTAEPPYAVLCSAWLDHPTLAELYRFAEMVERFTNNRYFPSLWAWLRRSGEDPFAFFEKLHLLCRKNHFFHRAPTQELLTDQLVELLSGRAEASLLLGLLRYDWLRCGFRFLPPSLELPVAEEAPAETRSRLYQSLAEEIPGLYERAGRNHFFRKSFFLRATPSLLRELDLPGDTAASTICFLAEKEVSLHRFQRVVPL